MRYQFYETSYSYWKNGRIVEDRYSSGVIDLFHIFLHSIALKAETIRWEKYGERGVVMGTMVGYGELGKFIKI